MPSARSAEPLLSERESVLDDAARRAALERYRTLPSGRERTSRYWRVDLDALALDESAFAAASGSVEIACDDTRVRVGEPCRAFGATRAADSKFGALAIAYANRHAFITIPEGIDVAAPIVITYRVGDGENIFPYTCVHVERGARATVVERIEAGSGAFFCGVTEILTEESSDLTFAAFQDAASDARIITTRAALPGKDARLSLDTADLGASLVVGDVDVAMESSGAEAHVASIFFPQATQHVDVRSNIDHRVGGTTSRTTVKSAATGRGQARYVGNIRIAAQAQKSDASLRDDALLLSPTAHIDSVPALEIAANDVKAYHGATVGALDAETLFYMTTRGIERDAAERMVTLGFFENAIEQFPSMLRDELRASIEAKVR